MSTIAPLDPSCLNSIFVLGRLSPSMDDEELTCLDHLWADTHPPAKLPTTAGEKSSFIFYLLSVFEGSQMWDTGPGIDFLHVASCCDRLWYFCCKLNFMNLPELQNVKNFTQTKSFWPNFTQEKCKNCDKLNTEIERNWYKWLLPWEKSRKILPIKLVLNKVYRIYLQTT